MRPGLALDAGLRRGPARRCDLALVREGDQPLPAGRLRPEPVRHPHPVRARRLPDPDRLRFPAHRRGQRQADRPGGVQHRRTLPARGARLRLRAGQAERRQRGQVAGRPVRPELRRHRRLRQLQRHLLVHQAPDRDHHPGPQRRRLRRRRLLRARPGVPGPGRPHRPGTVAEVDHPHRVRRRGEDQATRHHLHRGLPQQPRRLQHRRPPRAQPAPRHRRDLRDRQGDRGRVRRGRLRPRRAPEQPGRQREALLPGLLERRREEPARPQPRLVPQVRRRPGQRARPVRRLARPHHHVPVRR